MSIESHYTGGNARCVIMLLLLTLVMVMLNWYRSRNDDDDDAMLRIFTLHFHCNAIWIVNSPQLFIRLLTISILYFLQTPCIHHWCVRGVTIHKHTREKIDAISFESNVSALNEINTFHLLCSRWIGQCESTTHPLHSRSMLQWMKLAVAQAANANEWLYNLIDCVWWPAIFRFMTIIAEHKMSFVSPATTFECNCKLAARTH